MMHATIHIFCLLLSLCLFFCFSNCFHNISTRNCHNFPHKIKVPK